METTKEQPKLTAKSLKELLDKLAWQRESEALYEAFIGALESIGDRDIKAETCMNTVRYIATQNATADVTDKTSSEELADLFEAECKRFAADLLEMPGQFRDWLKKHPMRDSIPRATGRVRSTIDVLVGLGNAGLACDCERCVAFRASVQGESTSETPTEIPPPPDPTH